MTVGTVGTVATVATVVTIMKVLKKSCNLSTKGVSDKNHATSSYKKITQPLHTKNHATLTKKIMQPLHKKIMETRKKKKYATSQ